MKSEAAEATLSLTIFRDILRSTRRISGIIWREKRTLAIFLALVLTVLSTTPFLVSGSLGFLINELVKSATLRTIRETLVWATAFLIIARLIPPLMNTIQSYLLRQFWFFLEEKFETTLVRKKGDIDVAVHEDPKHNDLFNKVRENGIWRIQNFSDRQFFIFQNTLEVVIASVILFLANKWLLLLMVVGTIPELVTEMRYGREVWGIHGARAEVRRRFWDLHGHFERLPSLIELKLFQNINYFISTIKEIFQAFQFEQKRVERRKLMSQLASLLISQVVIVFVTVWFVVEVVQGKLQVGTLTFFLASMGDLRQSLSGLFGNLGRQYQDGLFVRDVFTLLDLPPALPKPRPAIVLNPQKTPTIIFKNVTFRYPGTEKAVLENFSLVIPPGEKVAIVGANGAGKTTLVKLLCRFYDPDKGSITIDGHNVKTVDLESWYHQLGVIFQDYSNYHFIVKEAIALGRTDEASPLQKVKDAARASEADIFIEEWEKSYEQMLGKHFQGGVEPSIGQWQKLALARTFYRDPRILILDEPTSSIDAEAEAKIFEKLEALPKDRTVILISHRFSTVRQANKICVIKDGSPIELGTHTELLKRNGTYARLFRLQAKGYQ